MANPVELKKRVGNQQGERQQVNEIAVGNLEKQGLTLSVVVYPPPTPTERHESDSVVSLLQFQSSQESLAHQPGSLPTGFFLSTEAVVFFPKGGGKKKPSEISKKKQEHVDKRKEKKRKRTLQDAARDADGKAKATGKRREQRRKKPKKGY